MKKRALVTGGAGFIGSNLAIALVRRGWKVRVLDNFSEGRLQNLASVKKDVEILRGDIRRRPDCKKAVKGVDVVFHQASYKSVPKSILEPFAAHEGGATGTLNMLEAAREAKVRRFVAASSSSVYGVAKKFPVTEEFPVAPLSPYGVAKLAAEKYVYTYWLNHGMETASLRYFNVFGPHQNPASSYSAVVPAFIDSLRRGVPPVINGGEQTRDFSYVGDVVNANILAATKPGAVGQIFNIAGGKDRSVLDLYKTIARIMGKSDVKPRFAPRRASDALRSFADTSKARKLLGWKPETSFEDGLRRTVAWFAEKQS